MPQHIRRATKPERDGAIRSCVRVPSVAPSLGRSNPSSPPSVPPCPRASVPVLALLTLTALLPACQSPGDSATFVFPAAEYAGVLESARETLRAAGYTVERVDAVRGEVSTAPKTVAGLVTPFEPEPSTVGQVWQDTLNRQPRTVRITFRDAESAQRGDPAPPGQGEIIGEVEVVIWRGRNPGWRLETEAIQESRSWIDPALTARGITAGMLVPVRQDPAFAAELAGKIRPGSDEG